MVTIHTDGGCWPNPGVGGWSAVIDIPGLDRIELQGGEVPSTSNQMELMGSIAALEYLQNSSVVTLYSDSRYVVDGITRWMDKWKRRGWRTVSGGNVRNRELWERLERACARHEVTFRWIPGHSGIAANERADALCREGAIEACGHAIDFENYSSRRAGTRVTRNRRSPSSRSFACAYDAAAA